MDQISSLPIRKWQTESSDDYILTMTQLKGKLDVQSAMQPLDRSAAKQVWDNLFGECKSPFHPQRVSGWMKYALRYFDGNKHAGLVPKDQIDSFLGWDHEQVVFLVCSTGCVYAVLWNWLLRNFIACEPAFDCAVLATNESASTLVYWEGSGPIGVKRRKGFLWDIGTEA